LAKKQMIMNFASKIRIGILFVSFGIFILIVNLVSNFNTSKELSDYDSKIIFPEKVTVETFIRTDFKGRKNKYYEMVILTNVKERFYVRQPYKKYILSLLTRIPKKKYLRIYYSNELGRNGGYPIRGIYLKGQPIFSFEEYLDEVAQRYRLGILFSFFLLVIGVFTIGLYFSEKKTD